MEGYSSTGNLPGGLFINNFETRLLEHKVLEARGGGQADLRQMADKDIFAACQAQSWMLLRETRPKPASKP